MGTKKKLWLASGFLVGLILLLLWLQGWFAARLGPGTTPVAQLAAAGGRPYVVNRQAVTDWQEAPGGGDFQNPSPRWRPRSWGRVVAVKVQAGDRVQAGQLLAVLEEQEVRARLGQAEENLAAVHIPEPRLELLAKLFNSKRRCEATLDFIDLPGSAEGDSEQAGLERHVPTLRQVDALVLVVRASVRKRFRPIATVSTSGRP